jgi:hypothetical protein
MKTSIALLTALAVLALAATSVGAADKGAHVGPDKVVYHISDTEEQASAALRYIENHLEVNPKAKVVVVTHAAGVDFLLDGARNRTGNPYNIPVESLASRGVRFEVCEITLRERKLPKSRFIPEASYVPSGVAEIARLQQREGYAYLRP